MLSSASSTTRWKVAVAITIFIVASLGFMRRHTPQLHLLYPVTQPFSNEVCRAMAASIRQGFQPTLLVMQNSSFYEGNLRKIPTIYNYLEKGIIDPSDIVTVVDAYDTWPQEDPESMMRKFNDLDTDILCAADKVCWPPGEVPRCEHVPASPLPNNIYGQVTDKYEHTTRPRWLNNGILIGRAHALQTFTSQLKQFIQVYFNYHGKITYSDQEFYAAFFASSTDFDYKMKLDYLSQIIQTMSFSIEDIEYVASSNAFRNKVTGTLPTFLHFPGSAAKEDMPQMYRAYPWVLTTQAQDGKVAFQYKPDLENILDRAKLRVFVNDTNSYVSYRSICQHHVF